MILMLSLDTAMKAWVQSVLLGLCTTWFLKRKPNGDQGLRSCMFPRDTGLDSFVLFYPQKVYVM
jgi:hypothetical protein